MPCFKCANGKWKFGQSGACKHSSKGACDRANRKKEKPKTAPRKRKIYGKSTMERAVINRLRKDGGS